MPCEKTARERKRRRGCFASIMKKVPKMSEAAVASVCQRLHQAVCVMRECFFLKTEMHANTKQTICFSQARQIEKCAMFQNRLYTFQVRIIITCFFSCNLDEWVMELTLKRRTCTAVQTRLMNARCLLFLLTVLLYYIYWQSALN